MDTVAHQTANKIVQLNQEIMLTLQQWIKSSQLTPDTSASSIPHNVIQKMRNVDALLLIIGQSPLYIHIIAKHGMGHDYENRHYYGVTK
ncbi:hypothetical protein [Alteromonas sp. P256]|uniref:hypothetical protein n=1 Tax=Alteromonas sp. P256 TaxID=3117399 RepID=UPI002FE2E65A